MDYTKPFMYKGRWYRAELDKDGTCAKCAFKGKFVCNEELPSDMTNYCFYHCSIFRQI